MSLDTSQLNDLSQQFLDLGDSILDKYIVQAGNIAGIEVQKEARSLSAIDTGALRRSIQETLSQISNGVSVIVAPTEKYASAVEFGQPPDTYVSPEALKPWLRRHGIPESAAYAVSRKIMKVGTKAQPFLFPAFEKKQDTILLIIAQGIVNALEATFKKQSQ